MINDFIKSKRSKDKTIKDEIAVTDGSWVSTGFLVKDKDLDKPYNTLRFTSPADKKFVDTSMGGNISINCYPQFTRYCDIRTKGILNGRNDVKVNDLSGNIGMGEYYATTIDDNSTNVYFEFGVPEFNNIAFFLLSSIDYKQAVIANSGRSPIFYNAGYVFGLGALFLAFPLITIGVLVAKAVFSLGTNILGGGGKFDHYYLKPTMFTYWSTVNSLVTMMSTELGILSPIFMKNKANPKNVGAPLGLDKKQLSAIRKLMPGLVTSGNAINVHAMVARTQVMYSKYFLKKTKQLKSLGTSIIATDTNSTVSSFNIDNVTSEELSGNNDLWHKLKKTMKQDKRFDGEKTKPKDLKSVIDNLTTTQTSKDSKGNDVITSETSLINPDGSVPRGTRSEDSKSWIDNAVKTTSAVFNEGARYAVFRVDHLASTTESFSNSTTSVGLGDKINGLGKTWRELKVTAAGMAPDFMKTAIAGVTDAVVGATSGLTLGLSDVVAGFLSGANIEVPKRWDSSSASFPSMSFKMQLVSPSAHPIAQLRNLYIPLASILAGALPLATGPRSHTSPFICNMFVRGRQRINLGMITSLSITRGTSNLPYNKQRRPLAIDVTFTVTDFYDVMSAPVTKDLLSTGNTMFDDEAGINRYIQALCARDLYSTVHIFDRAKIKASRALQTANLAMSPETAGAWVGDMFSNSTLYSIFADKKKVNYSEMY